jgi:hypothetical protein
MLFYLIYMSKATKLMPTGGLHHVLQQSRDWNKEHNLTGMLAYIEGKVLNNTEGRFIQALEGPVDEVLHIFNRISKDDRHGQITVLAKTATTKRYFEQWAMGFEFVSPEKHNDLRTFFFMDDALLTSNAFQKNDAMLKFLRSFYVEHQATLEH